MKRVAWLVLAACTAQGQSRESVTVVAPPPSKECPPNTVFNGVQCAELLSHATSIDAGAVAPSLPAERPNLTDEARDLRALSKTPRAVALLTVELNALEQLKNASSTSSPDYPQIVRRMGEGYSELAYASSFAGDPKTATAARRKAIGEYTTLVTNYPTFPRLDEVLYYLGYSYELDGDLMNARKTYYALIQKFPSSTWIPYAYYSFGEAFAAEAKSDPTKWQMATQAYLEVLKFANAPNILPWAYLRAGQSLDAQGGQGDHARATQMFTKLKRDFPQSKAAAEAP